MIDFFALLGIPRKFNLDLSQLRKSYYSESRKVHPDQQEVEDHLIIEINQAYNSLKDPLLRLKHILELEDAIKLIDQPLDSEFLFNMMEWNERIDQVKMLNDDVEKTKLMSDLLEYENNLFKTYKKPIEDYDSGDRTPTIIHSLVNYFIRLKYLKRLQLSLEGKEEI